MKTLGDMSYAEIGKQLSTLADAYDVKLPRELVLIGKQFLYVERYMKLLAPKWQMMSDPQFSGYFANFMVEVSREHQKRRRGLGHRGSAAATRTAPTRDIELHYEDLGDLRRPAGAADHGPGRPTCAVAQRVLRETRRPAATG